jgi:hypothetical protein
VSENLHPQLAWQFERELLHQWAYVARSVGIMNSVLQNKSNDQDVFWFAVDAALGAFGNISKVFWPTRSASKATTARCAAMRRTFKIPDGAMLKNRRVRDSLEHFDERLDRWYRTSQRKNFADQIIAPRAAIVGIDPGDYARHFDPETSIVTIFGDDLDFQALVSEVDALMTEVRTRHQVIWWDRPGAAQQRP